MVGTMSTQTMTKKKKFVADGIFFAEVNEFFSRELGEDGEPLSICMSSLPCYHCHCHCHGHGHCCECSVLVVVGDVLVLIQGTRA